MEKEKEIEKICARCKFFHPTSLKADAKTRNSGLCEIIQNKKDKNGFFKHTYPVQIFSYFKCSNGNFKSWKS